MNTNGKSSKEQNIAIENKIMLFSSKKLAENYKDIRIGNSCDIIVVGVSQEHLKEIKKINECNKVSVYLTDFTLETVELSQWDIDLYIR